MNQHPQPGGGADGATPEAEHHKSLNEIYETPTDLLGAIRHSAASPLIDEIYAKPESRFMRLYWKPLPVTLGFGVLAAACLTLAFLLDHLLMPGAFDTPLWMKLSRVGLFFTGAVFLMLAAPLYKYRDWTQEQQEADDDMHEDFRRRHRK